MNVREFLASKQLTPGSFEGESWQFWRAVLSAAFGLPLDAEQERAFERLAGGRTAPQSRVRELWVVAGRRSAKTHVSAAVAVYLATIGAELDGTLRELSAGERGIVQLIAVDRKQAAVALGYIRGLLHSSPTLSAMVQRESGDAIDLDNHVSLEVVTNSFRSVRGRTLVAAILDECAFYRDAESATPDVETYRAIVPSLATTGGLLIGVSSPYAKRGLLHAKWQKHYGKDGDVLVLQGATRDFNPLIDPRIIADAEADDPAAAKAEWHGQFRDDVEAFLAREVVEQARRSSPLELPYDRRHRYEFFADPAGGGADEFTIAGGHMEADRAIIDVLRARRGTPADIVAEYAALLRSYRVSRITADRYAGSWPSDEFKRHGITCASAKKSKSDLYVDVLAAFNSGRVEIPPDDRLVAQFIGLERRTARSGRDSVDHAPNSHDDRSNAVAGLVEVLAAHSRRPRWAVYLDRAEIPVAARAAGVATSGELVEWRKEQAAIQHSKAEDDPHERKRAAERARIAAINEQWRRESEVPFFPRRTR